jgi:hypothetical protein
MLADRESSLHHRGQHFRAGVLVSRARRTKCAHDSPTFLG